MRKNLAKVNEYEGGAGPSPQLVSDPPAGPPDIQVSATTLHPICLLPPLTREHRIWWGFDGGTRGEIRFVGPCPMKELKDHVFLVRKKKVFFIEGRLLSPKPAGVFKYVVTIFAADGSTMGEVTGELVLA
jgi:hypothetical protein